ncbi:unnamed protein product [Auanema sp. JU1783]|nr:unnamed protein product [Auanema sp. JU1783]
MNITYPIGCDSIPSLDRLVEHSIIDVQPNFTGCLPQCGLCEHSLRESHYVLYNLIISGFILPLIGLLGLIGNGLSAFIYSRPDMRCSTNLYLCALGCSDSAVILTGIFLFFVESVRKFSHNLTRVFGAFSPIVYPMGMTAQTCSVYFTLMAGIDCFAQVCMPGRVREFISSPKFVRKSVFAVLIWSVLYNIPHCFEAIVIDCYHVGFDGSSWEVCPETMRFNEMYQTVYYQYMYAVFLAVGPLVILVILNTFIICASMFGNSGASKDDTISLVLVVLLFIACNVAALLLNTFEGQIEELIGPKINYFVDLSNLLVVFNSSFNFVIYFKFSSSFRTTLFRYLKSKHEKSVHADNPNLPPIVITEEQLERTRLCKETLGKLLAAGQAEVLM